MTLKKLLLSVGSMLLMAELLLPVNSTLYFVPNTGQFSKEIVFAAVAPKFSLMCSSHELLFIRDLIDPESFKQEMVRLSFLGIQSEPKIEARDSSGHRVSFFLGRNVSRWKKNLQASKTVVYNNLYQDIDLKIYGSPDQVEYDWIVHSDARAEDIRFKFEGAARTYLNDGGDLIIETSSGKWQHARPIAYQIIRGKRHEVEARFKKIDEDHYGFEVGEFDHTVDLILDPIVTFLFSSYLGGGLQDSAQGIAVDKLSAVYVAGTTSSPYFPTDSSMLGTRAGNGRDCFVAKLNSSGTGLEYSIFFGGQGKDEATAIAVDEKGFIYVTGFTDSTDFPSTGFLQKDLAGGVDAFVAKISPQGDDIVFVSLLGGSSDDRAEGIAVSQKGEVFLAGNTRSKDFPVFKPFQDQLEGAVDAFLVKLHPNGSNFVYATFFGGDKVDKAKAVDVNSKGQAVLVGWTRSNDFPLRKPIQKVKAGKGDAFVLRISEKGDTLLSSTYFGGSGMDTACTVKLDPKSNIYVGGTTRSENLPVKDALFPNYSGKKDAFMVKMNRKGNKIVYATFLGGFSNDEAAGLVVNDKQEVTITGYSQSSDFPIANPTHTSFSGMSDIFVTRLSARGDALLFSVFLGGSNEDRGYGVAEDLSGDIYITGSTRSGDFYLLDPIQTRYWGYGDAFLARLHFDKVPPPCSGCHAIN